MQGSYLGPEYTSEIIQQELKNLGAKFEVLNDENLINNEDFDLIIRLIKVEVTIHLTT